MPPVTVKSKSGRVLGTVEAPEGTSDAEVRALWKTQRSSEGEKNREFAQPGEKVGTIPSPSRFIAEGIKRRGGDILSMAGGALMPGSGALGLASRLIGAEAGQEAGDALTQGKIQPGKGALAQGLGEAVAAPARALLSPGLFRRFGNRVATGAAEWLRKNVDAWYGFDNNAKSLYSMAHKDGPRLLSREFEGALRRLKGRIPDDWQVNVESVLEQPRTAMAPLGQTPIPTPAPTMQTVSTSRNAKVLIDELPALREAGGPAYRQALKALDRDLPQGVMPELDEMRRQYRIGSGWVDIATKGKFLHGEHLDPLKAQEALDRHGKALMNRGMDELWDILRGPGTERIRATTHSPMGRRLYGAAIGEAAGLPFGWTGRIAGPLVGGAIGEHVLPRATYQNVPKTALGRFASRLGPVAVGQGAREAARVTGMDQALPSLPQGAP